VEFEDLDAPTAVRLSIWDRQDLRAIRGEVVERRNLRPLAVFVAR